MPGNESKEQRNLGHPMDMPLYPPNLSICSNMILSNSPFSFAENISRTRRMTLTHCRANPGEEKMFHSEGSKTDTLQDACEKHMGRQDKSSERWEQATKSLCTYSLTSQHNLFALFLSLRKPA